MAPLLLVLAGMVLFLELEHTTEAAIAATGPPGLPGFRAIG